MKQIHTFTFIVLCIFCYGQTNPTKTLYFKTKPAKQVEINNIIKNKIKLKKASKISRKQLKTPSSSGIERISKIEYTGSLSEKEACELLMSSGNYEYVLGSIPAHPLLVPNDPFASDGFSNSRDGQTPLFTHTFWEAWDLEQGDTNITIAIIDGGMNLDHEDLQGNQKINYADPINGINDDMNWFSDVSFQLTDDYRGWDVSDWDNDVTAPPGVTHGTEVTGLAAATSNNGIGIAGAGFNTKYVHYKVSPDNNPYNYNTGYEGAVIAAENGADIINLSWGAEASIVENFLPLINDILNYVTIDLGKIVVAAAGNSGNNEAYYPASHPNVISVTGIRDNNTKQNLSTYDYNVDIAASGWFAKTTLGNTNNDYQNSTGTSVASPIVSGAMALVKSHFPAFTNKQIIEQVRVSSEIIDTIEYNLPFQYKMGRKLNPYEALTNTTIPSIRTISNSASYSTFPSGDFIHLDLKLTNYLAPSTDLNVSLISTNPDYLITGSQTVAYFNTNDTIALLDDITIATPAITDTTTITFILKFEDGEYLDYEHVEITFVPDYITTIAPHANHVLSISPNPAKSQLQINLANQTDITSLSINDLNGLTIHDLEVKESSNRLHVQLPNDIKKGVYILNITSENGFFTEKLFIE